MAIQGKSQGAARTLFPPEPGEGHPDRLRRMHLAFGSMTGERCRDCAHLAVHEKTRRFYKCGLSRVSRSAATDWRAKWPACGKFARTAVAGRRVAALTAVPEPPDEFVDDVIPQNPDGKDLREEAGRWIRNNPAAYDDLLRWARQRHEQGLAFNITILSEQLRLYGRQTRLEGDPFALNNNHRAYIARRMAADAPELLGCFRFRRTRY